MQTPLQLISPVGHETEHMPALHTWPVAHAVPEVPASAAPQPAVAPQWVGSVSGLMQMPLQLISPVGHERAHMPPLQTWPFTHCVPRLLPASSTPQPGVAPQKVGSVAGLMQMAPQFTSPVGHETEHTPPLQTWPFRHSVPAEPASPMSHPAVAPQCMLLLVGSTHIPPQTSCIPGHDVVHPLFTHALPGRQALPHVPQLFASLLTIAQYHGPASGTQRVWFAPHVALHLPPEHAVPA
jgi:hypothetical protein